MSVEIKTDEDVVTSFLSGEIDHHVALPIREKTDAAIISAHPKRVVLDFSGVTFMDSSGIGLVMGRYKICESMGASLEIHGLSRHAYKVMWPLNDLDVHLKTFLSVFCLIVQPLPGSCQCGLLLHKFLCFGILPEGAFHG